MQVTKVLVSQGLLEVGHQKFQQAEVNQILTIDEVPETWSLGSRSSIEVDLYQVDEIFLEIQGLLIQ